MREDIRDGSGNLVGWKENKEGRTDIWGSDGDYKGHSDSTGTHSSRDGFKYTGQNEDLLLDD